jgi:poly-gamma-glutamate biosynthesis protein PgsC/CapC
VVELAIALGIAVSLLVSEVVGVSAAGLVVPGYLALHLDQPARLAATFAVALATWALVRFGLSRLVVLYGRRRLAVAVLAGFLLNVLAERLLLALPAQPVDARVIGYIVPGLIASEAVSQGVVPTFAVTILVAVVVRLLLALLLPWMA